MLLNWFDAIGLSFGEEVMPNRDCIFQDRMDDWNIEVKELGVGNPCTLKLFQKIQLLSCLRMFFFIFTPWSMLWMPVLDCHFVADMLIDVSSDVVLLYNVCAASLARMSQSARTLWFTPGYACGNRSSWTEQLFRLFTDDYLSNSFSGLLFKAAYCSAVIIG